MKIQFEMDEFLELSRTLDKTGKAIDEGARIGMGQALAIWYAEAFDAAPEKTGNLKDGISDAVKGDTVATLTGELGAEAWSTWKGKPFNYAYYVHQVRGNKFLLTSFDAAEARMKKAIEQAIVDALRKAGW